MLCIFRLTCKTLVVDFQHGASPQEDQEGKTLLLYPRDPAGGREAQGCLPDLPRIPGGNRQAVCGERGGTQTPKDRLPGIRKPLFGPRDREAPGHDRPDRRSCPPCRPGDRSLHRRIFLLRLGEPAHRSEEQTRPAGLVPGHRGLRDPAGADRGTLLATVLGEMGPGLSGSGGRDRERVLLPCVEPAARTPGVPPLRHDELLHLHGQPDRIGSVRPGAQQGGEASPAAVGVGLAGRPGHGASPVLQGLRGEHARFGRLPPDHRRDVRGDVRVQHDQAEADRGLRQGDEFSRGDSYDRRPRPGPLHHHLLAALRRGVGGDGVEALRARGGTRQKKGRGRTAGISHEDSLVGP